MTALYNLTFARQVRKKDLPKIPPKERSRILETVEKLQYNPRPFGALRLTNREEYRIRQGDYRVLYVIEDQIKIVEIRHIAQRGEAYR